MAKKPGKVALNLGLLKQIYDATQAGGSVYVGPTPDTLALAQHNPPLIQVNQAMPDPSDPQKLAARTTDAAGGVLAAGNAPVEAEGEAPKFEVMNGIVLPPSKRGNAKGGGAPVVYPFDSMEIGQSFFVPVSAKHKDPFKTLGSTVSSANMRYAIKTGETKQVERTKRGPGNKAVVDVTGAKVKETVSVEVTKKGRNFTIRKIEKGVNYGTAEKPWIAPDNGALIMRVALDAE